MEKRHEALCLYGGDEGIEIVIQRARSETGVHRMSIGRILLLRRCVEHPDTDRIGSFRFQNLEDMIQVLQRGRQEWLQIHADEHTVLARQGEITNSIGDRGSPWLDFAGLGE
ncbi:hypothetical protein D3C86_1495010 [compost metagenome]